MPGNCDPPKEHQWQPGQSGNPSGKPRGARTWAGIMRDFSEKTSGEILGTSDKRNAADAIVQRLIADAIRGDRKAAEIVLDRMEGKPRQSVLVNKREKSELTVINKREGEDGEES